MRNEHRAGAVTSPLQGLCAPQANSQADFSSKSIIKLQFLSKSRPWTLAVVVVQRSSAPRGAHSEQPALPGTGSAAWGIAASSSPGLFPCWDELWRC